MDAFISEYIRTVCAIDNGCVVQDDNPQSIAHSFFTFELYKASIINASAAEAIPAVGIIAVAELATSFCQGIGVPANNQHKSLGRIQPLR